MFMSLSVISIFNFYFNCTEGVFYKSKINGYGIYVVKNKTWQGGFVYV